MELLKSNFDVKKNNNGIIFFTAQRKNNAVYETPHNFIKKVFVENNKNKFVLQLIKVIFKKDEIIFKFKPSKNNIPNKLLNTKIRIFEKNNTLVKIPEKKLEEPKINSQKLEEPKIDTLKIEEPKINNLTYQQVNVRSPPKVIRNPYIYTNVESGYSARSFPSVYIARYKYGPQGNKFQTTPQVSPFV